MKMWKSVQTDGRTDDRWSEELTWAFSSGRLIKPIISFASYILIQCHFFFLYITFWFFFKIHYKGFSQMQNFYNNTYICRRLSWSLINFIYRTKKNYFLISNKNGNFKWILTKTDRYWAVPKSVFRAIQMTASGRLVKAEFTQVNHADVA